MKISLAFPILLTARPVGSRKARDLHLVSRAEYEIPEHSLSEAEIAYRKYDTPNSAVYGSDFLDVIRFSGRLFRPLGAIENAVETHYSLPFYATLDNSFADHGLNAHFEGLLRLQQSLGLRSRKTWPDPIDTADSRNTTAFEDVLPKLHDIELNERNEAMASVDRAVSGLMMFSGQLWCETPAPRRRVGLEEWHASPFFCTQVRTAFVDEFPTYHYFAASRDFAVSDQGAARAYEEELRAFTPKKNREVERREFEGSVAHIAEEAYDGSTEQVRRISRELAYASVVTAHSKPALAERLSDDSLKLIGEAKNALLDENYVLGRRFDMSQDCRELLSAWRTLGRPRAEACFGWKAVDVLDSFLEYTVDAWEPISVPIDKSVARP
jgi:hypothetical protein